MILDSALLLFALVSALSHAWAHNWYAMVWSLAAALAQFRILCFRNQYE